MGRSTCVWSNDTEILSVNLSPDLWMIIKSYLCVQGSGVKLGTIPAPYETVKSGFVGILDGDCI